jgi:fucose permease
MSACEKLSSAALVQIIGYIAAVVLGALIAVIGLLFFAALFAAAAGR